MKKSSILKLSAALIAIAVVFAAFHDIGNYESSKSFVLTAQTPKKAGASRGSSKSPMPLEKTATAVNLQPTRQQATAVEDYTTSSEIKPADTAASETASFEGSTPIDASSEPASRPEEESAKHSLNNAEDTLTGGGVSAPADSEKENNAQHTALPSEIMDVEYKRIGGKSLLLDIYRPENDFLRQSPALVYIHGGGWIYGSKNGSEVKALKPYFDSLRKRGFTVVAINYSLATSGGTFPAPAQDCKDALRWLSHNSDKYGIDRNNIGLWGSSSGAHLAMLCAYEPESGPAGDQAFYTEVPPVRYVVDFFGPVTFSGDEIPSSHFVKKLMGSYYSDKSMLEKASPITYVNKYSPPTLIVHGEADSLVPLAQSELLYSAFRENEVPSELIVVPGAEHTLINASNEDLTSLFGEVIGFIESNSLK
ncbi:triacylglycerol lipase (plasmid) [Peptoclostridium acidaminophilum DSM 3953]|uniref:Triacylglycerol lipase n=1 Tax=Peptoclostridium acidaminophilum DSM 3953 TaxID=1286171 RepID=W8T911_PEPAC|nr:alpha/beta hydrolase [Peptoclostridium acidaminophilum]AHM58149.1 triacylglycerol lipase [Peptoclostridium acidaminophilum DSM 3953]